MGAFASIFKYWNFYKTVCVPLDLEWHLSVFYGFGADLFTSSIVDFPIEVFVDR